VTESLSRSDEEILRLCREWWSERSRNGGSANFIDEAFAAGFKAAVRLGMPSETQAAKPAPGCGHAYGACLHAWDERRGPMPASWMCGCGAKVYRSYEDYCDG
jgi:hypothetical protein